MKMILDKLPPGLRVGTPVLVSAAAVGISTITIALVVGAVGSSLLLPSVDETDADPLTKLAADSAREIETSRKRFENRSMYSLPPAPPRRVPIVKREDPKPPPPVDPGPPPIPKTYAGPQPTSFLGDFVVFGSLTEDDKRIRVGQTKAGIKVISIDAPYFVKLGYQGGEYDVPVLTRFDPSILSREAGSWRRSNLDGGSSSVSLSSGSSATSRSDTAGGVGSGRAGLGGTTRPGSLAKDGGGAAGTQLGSSPGGDSQANANSSAMQPQRLSPPEPSSESPPDEYVDRELLPPRLSEEEINGFTQAQARAALEAINATEAWNVDDHSRARLNHEKALLKARLSRD